SVTRTAPPASAAAAPRPCVKALASSSRFARRFMVDKMQSRRRSPIDDAMGGLSAPQSYRRSFLPRIHADKGGLARIGQEHFQPRISADYADLAGALLLQAARGEGVSAGSNSKPRLDPRKPAPIRVIRGEKRFSPASPEPQPAPWVWTCSRVASKRTSGQRSRASCRLTRVGAR